MRAGSRPNDFIGDKKRFGTCGGVCFVWVVLCVADSTLSFSGSLFIYLSVRSRVCWCCVHHSARFEGSAANWLGAVLLPLALALARDTVCCAVID